MKSPRVVIIGAGSTIFGLNTLVRSSRLKGGTLSLVDLNTEGLTLVDALAWRLNREWEAGLNHFTWILDLRDRRTGEDLYPAFRHAFIDLPQDFEPLQGLLLDPCVNDPDNAHAILSAYLTEYAQYLPQFDVLR